VLKIARVIPTPHPGNDFLACAKVARVRAAMQFVLEAMLDVILEVLGDVVPMGNVTDARERD
jgi:hypothetical protein